MSEIPIGAQGALWRCFGRFYSRSGDLSHRSNDVVKNTVISEVCSLSRFKGSIPPKPTSNGGLPVLLESDTERV